MGVLALALGSRGDVEPLAVLVAELQRRGASARLACPRDEAPVARALGAQVVELPLNVSDAVGRASRSKLAKPLAGQAVLLRRWLRAAAPEVAQVLVDEVQPGDTLISGILGRDVVAAFARSRACRQVTMLFTGQLPTAHRESHMTPHFFTDSAGYNRAGSKLSWWMQNELGAPLTAQVRKRLRGGASSRSDAEEQLVIAASPLIVPPAPDWPANAHQTGYLATPVPEDVEVPEDLLAFLDAGEPPVYIGWGSLGAGLPSKVRGWIPKAARAAGLRVLTPALPNRRVGHARRDVFVTGPVPHSWLFPQTAGVVHHGGAGHTWTALCAGVPSVAVPVGVDQPFHAGRIHALGVGPAPISAHDLTEAKLAELLLDLTSGAFAARASQIGNLARAEDGLEQTIGLLERSHLV